MTDLFLFIENTIPILALIIAINISIAIAVNLGKMIVKAFTGETEPSTGPITINIPMDEFWRGVAAFPNVEKLKNDEKPKRKNEDIIEAADGVILEIVDPPETEKPKRILQ